MSYIKELLVDAVMVEHRNRWNSMQYNPEGTRSPDDILNELRDELKIVLDGLIYVRPNDNGSHV